MYVEDPLHEWMERSSSFSQKTLSFHLTKKKTNFVFANNNFYNSSFSEPKQAIQGLFFAFFLAPPVLENHSTKSVQVEEEKLQS